MHIAFYPVIYYTTKYVLTIMILITSYASHSFRISATTTAVATELTPLLIKTLGRWNI